MEKKEKIEKNITKNNTNKLILAIILLVLFLIFAIINSHLSKEVTYASSGIIKEEKTELVISGKEKIDLNNIINRNLEKKERQ